MSAKQKILFFLSSFLHFPPPPPPVQLFFPSAIPVVYFLKKKVEKYSWLLEKELKVKEMLKKKKTLSNIFNITSNVQVCVTKRWIKTVENMHLTTDVNFRFLLSSYKAQSITDWGTMIDCKKKFKFSEKNKK